MRKISPPLFLLLLFLYLIFLIRSVFLGQLSGTFRRNEIPPDYISLENFISSKSNYSRTLWFPSFQRYGYYSYLHPEVSANSIFNNLSYGEILKEFKINSTETILQNWAVRYVVVPYDSQEEIFLTDRKYDNRLYVQTINKLKNVKWLKEVNGFGKIAVFEVPNSKDHFYISNQQSETNNQKIEYRYVSPVEYKVEVANARKGDLIVFSENFDARWIATNSEFRIQSLEFNNRFNSFVLPRDGNYSLRIYYTPQDYVNIGLVISGLTLIIVISVLIYLRKKR